MNQLSIKGRLVVKDGNKFISYLTQTKEYLLPIKVDEVFADGAWVSFTGTLNTKRKENEKGKIWFGQGTLSSGVEGEYLDEFSAEGTIVRIFDMRTTPLTSRKVIDFTVACGDSYYNCIAFGTYADQLVRTKKVGDAIEFNPAVFQSRDYTKEGETKTAYEVCVRRFN